MTHRLNNCVSPLGKIPALPRRKRIDDVGPVAVSRSCARNFLSIEWFEGEFKVRVCKRPVRVPNKVSE